MNQLRRPAVTVATRAKLPSTPVADDDNHWVTGRCWLWCGRESALVIWIGPATVAGGVSVPLFACEGCMRSLGDQILDTVMKRDDAGSQRLGYESVGIPDAHRRALEDSTPGGRHRRHHQ